jgi:hypothetical protein
MSLLRLSKPVSRLPADRSFDKRTIFAAVPRSRHDRGHSQSAIRRRASAEVLKIRAGTVVTSINALFFNVLRTLLAACGPF